MYVRLFAVKNAILILYLFIQSSYMGPWPIGYQTCQNLCNINKINIHVLNTGSGRKTWWFL